MTKKQLLLSNALLLATLAPLNTFCVKGTENLHTKKQYRYEPPTTIDEDGGTELHRAVCCGNVNSIKSLLQQNTDPNYRNSYGRSPLYETIWDNQFDIARCLLENGADADTQDGDGNSPLHLAVNAGHNYMAQFFLEYGANKNAQNAELNTPLHSAARWDRTNIVALLLEAGADPRTKNKKGELPTDIAKEFGHEEVARLLDTATERINGHVLPFPSRETAALRIMIGHTAREEAIATQS